MSCCFESIQALSKKQIDGSFCTESTTEGGKKYEQLSGFAAISCYSLSTTQKAVAITLCALAIIAFLVGAVSLGGTNFLGSTAAWALVGSGLGVAVGTVILMTLNHLLFLRKVNNYFKSTSFSEFSEAKNYIDHSGNLKWKDAEKGETSSMTLGSNNPFYVTLYSECDSGLIKFHMDFHRTKP